MNDDTQSALKLLAYYDVRGVAGNKLVAMFRCSLEDLENARQSEEYKEFLAEEHGNFEATRATLDDSWDAIEKAALGNLVDSMATTSDPRFLLAAAVQANKANRRNMNAGTGGDRKVIDVTPPAGQQTTVIRMRTRFLEIMQDENASKRVAARETEIVMANKQNLREDMSPREVQQLMRDSLGVDVTNEEQIQRSGNTEEMNFEFNLQSEFIKQLGK